MNAYSSIPWRKWILVFIFVGTVALLIQSASAYLWPGFLVVYSEPEGADVFLDGDRYWDGTTHRTPSEFNGLRLGSHTIRITKSGYIDYSTTVTITEGQQAQVKANLEPDPRFKMSLYIASDPSGAEFSIDGKYFGSTPKTITISPGFHEFSFTKRGFAKSTKINIVPEKHDLLVSLDPVYLAPLLSISSSPKGADVYIDGSPIGSTPINTTNIKPGDHTVRITKSGYNTYTTPIILLEGNTTRVDANLILLSQVEKSPIITIKTDTPILTPQPSSNETTNITESTTKTALLIPSVIAGIMIAGILLVKRKKGF